MADEHVLLKQVTVPISMTVANGTGINKGAVLKLADPATVSATTALNDIIGGVAAVEKIASDGTTQLAVFRGQGNWFKAVASGAVTVGDPLGLVGADGRPNLLRSIVNVIALSGAKCIGYALETAADGESFKYEMNISKGVGVA